MDYGKWTERYSVDCRLKYNSENTRYNYISQVRSFLLKFKDYEQPKTIPTDEIKEWLLQAKTINTRKHRLCAIKSFYELTVGMPTKISKIPYPKKDKKLPIVLSVDEIQSMFDVCENLKHKVIMAILYSCSNGDPDYLTPDIPLMLFAIDAMADKNEQVGVVTLLSLYEAEQSCVEEVNVKSLFPERKKFSDNGKTDSKIVVTSEEKAKAIEEARHVKGAASL